GFDANEAAREQFAAAGGEAGSGVEDVAGDADLLITMLPNGAIVRSALLDRPGFATALRPGAVVIDMSSSAPTQTIALAQELQAHDATLRHAPVSGRVAHARGGCPAL